jgi:hypothetical protein
VSIAAYDVDVIRTVLYSLSFFRSQMILEYIHFSYVFQFNSSRFSLIAFKKEIIFSRETESMKEV